jgi:2-methylisocitrate lyase-like PEP mutase family enzyme
VVDVLTARLAELAGFESCYVTGAGLANAQFGMADVGLTGLTDVVTQLYRIAGGVDVPVFVDADTGYGNAISVMHAVSELERAGAAAIQLEDQVFPKRCGHFDGKAVIDTDEMVQKVRAAVRARGNPDVLLVARTDARSVNGFDDAIERAQRYRDAGADILFVEAPESMEELERIPRLLEGTPVISNVVEGGRTPLCSARELEDMGYKILVYANLALRASIAAIRTVLGELRATGDTRPLITQIAAWEERQALVYLPLVERIEGEFAETRRGRGSQERAK